jgi:putative acetyltransferase
LLALSCDHGNAGGEPAVKDTPVPLRFELDPITSTAVRELVATHLATMHAASPPGSCHALAVEELQSRDVQFWSVWSDDELVGCGALETLSATDGEIKSMHVREGWRGRGLAARILAHLEDAARARGLERLWLETGSQAAFEPARRLYAAFGYSECGPFGDYTEDPNSTFMTRRL